MSETTKPSPLFLVLVCSLLAAGGALFLLPRGTARAESERERDSKALVSLFDQKPQCSAREPGASLRLGGVAEQRARAHVERAAFEPALVLAARQKWGQAAACFRAAGDTERALGAEEQQAKLRARAEGLVRLHQLRLRRAKKNKQPNEALSETRSLRELFDESSAYGNWLRAEERRLEKKVRDHR